MSTEALRDSFLSEGAPELTALGKRLEILRIERGISKQHLARFAGTSRQQLWRVMTGKSDLTDTLRHRLAQALGVDLSRLGTEPPTSTTNGGSAVAHLRLAAVDLDLPLESYLATAEHV